MKTEAELNSDILKITLDIQRRFPELSKFIAEMPVTIPTPGAEINVRALTDYYNSLNSMFKDYASRHIDWGA